jgi:ABC-type polysaccharide/polyol phosphate transport system ATPase subunit
MVLASHSAELITMMCQRALWLKRGEVVKQGTAAEVVAAHKATAT